MNIVKLEKYSVCFKHILVRRKGLGMALNATLPSPEVFSVQFVSDREKNASQTS